MEVNLEMTTRSPTKVRRKLSIPVSFNPNPDHQVPMRRRFSNVGDAVTRKLSTTIGWRTGNPPEEVVAVGKAMCILYVRTKLKRAGVFNRKLGLTRVRSTVGTTNGSGTVVRDVFPCLACACADLERMYPRLYTNIARQTGPAPGGGVGGLLLAVGHHMFRSDANWGKVVAVYSVAGGLAVDCVRQGQQEQLHVILEDMHELLEDRMAHWVHANGGWVRFYKNLSEKLMFFYLQAALTKRCKQTTNEISIIEYLAIFVLVLVILLVAYCVVRFFVKFSIF